ncbi:hypothetical protein B0H16DRAFT_108991 [Mycena metata]|uniref:Zn(2)-C6 fungal-type domain-containing protein n=1 Tax=Mycena metata TaxID=1033252 RepID=A0AAD7I828_9AGAR|nr:hypothetical protein B0H16DRAFT_108991 [Mycena metata]
MHISRGCSRRLCFRRTARELCEPTMQPRPAAGPRLPSIRQLHPYLPPTIADMDPGASTSTSPFVPYAPAPAPPQGGGGGYPPSSYAGSEGDERDAGGDNEPPKKKRRRQALSCTECKRRKIRCDRTQPCAPCVRRGDQAKCHWHVVEPATSSNAEKYVPRAEHEALRARVEVLEAYINSIPPSVLATLPPPGFAVPGSSSSGSFNAAQSNFDTPQGQVQLYTIAQGPGHEQSGFHSPPGQGLPPMQPFPGAGFQVQQDPGSFSGGQGHAASAGPFSGGIAPFQTQHQHTTGQDGGGSQYSRSPSHPRRASFSPTQPHTISPAQTQRRGSVSQQEQPQGVSTVSPADTQRRAASSSPVQRRRPSLQTQGGGASQWGGGFGSFPAASGAFTSSSSTGVFPSSSQGSGSTGGGNSGGTGTGGSGGNDTQGSPPSGAGGSFSTFSARPQGPSTRGHAAESPSLSVSPAFSAGSASGASGSGSRGSASFSSFSSSPGSSYSSATPTSYSHSSATPRPEYVPPAPGILYQPLHAHSSESVLPAQALARIIRPDVAAHVKREREREEPLLNVARQSPPHLRDVRTEPQGGGRQSAVDAPKNRPAQALQGARLRAGHAPWLQLQLLPPHARRRPPIPHTRLAPTTSACSWTLICIPTRRRSRPRRLLLTVRESGMSAALARGPHTRPPPRPLLPPGARNPAPVRAHLPRTPRTSAAPEPICRRPVKTKEWNV